MIGNLHAHAIRAVIGRPGGGRPVLGGKGPAAGQALGTTREGSTPGVKHLRVVSASAKQIGMRQGASARVKQSKSQQIVTNADLNASTPVIKSS